MERTTAGSVAGTGRRRPGRRPLIWLMAAGLPVAVSACGLHVSKHGVSGSAFGHHFSVASGQLPAGFPSDVPVPDDSRVLDGGGADNDWDVAFAVTGSIAEGSSAYQSKFESAGYTLSNVQSGSTPVTGAASGSSSTTLTLTGSLFTAKNAQWTVQVETGSESSAKGHGLRAGEFAVNITVVAASSAPPTT